MTLPDESEQRTYQIDIRACIFPQCNGEVYELDYLEAINWITAVFKCAKCSNEFTVKIEV